MFGFEFNFVAALGLLGQAFVAFADLDDVELVLGSGEFGLGVGDLVVKVGTLLLELVEFVGCVLNVSLRVVYLLSNGA